jgi:hypothetical protein
LAYERLYLFRHHPGSSHVVLQLADRFDATRAYISFRDLPSFFTSMRINLPFLSCLHLALKDVGQAKSISAKILERNPPDGSGELRDLLRGITSLPSSFPPTLASGRCMI